MSYIIFHGELIAKTRENIASGTRVKFSKLKCKEAIDANREFNLVNAQVGVISNAARWINEYTQDETAGLATEINPGEFLI